MSASLYWYLSESKYTAKSCISFLEYSVRYKPQGMKINDLYFSYKIEKTEKTVDGQQLKGWLVTESYSKTGLNGSCRKLYFHR